MHLPPARGPLSAWVTDRLSGGSTRSAPAALVATDALAGDDFHLALWICYELHFDGFDEVDPEMEWDLDLLRFRSRLETSFLAELRERVPAVDGPDVPTRLRELTANQTGPSLSAYLQRTADRAQFGEFVKHRSVYHLKEADPHTFAIPRLRGRSKAAMVEIQADEYGGGDHARMHSTLFATTMTGLGLDNHYGHYVSDVPGITLANNNVISLFGLHRRWRGAAAGHLASLEMTSSQPNRRYARGLQRLGGSAEHTRFFDEHVEADAVHEQIAAWDLCHTLACEQPELVADIVFGAAAGVLLDDLFGRHLLESWAAGHSSLVRAPAAVLAA